MNLIIEKKYEVFVRCNLCGEATMCSRTTSQMGLSDLKSDGWTVIRHRSGQASVVCPACNKRAADAKEARAKALAALRVKQLELDAEFEALKAGKLGATGTEAPEEANDGANPEN